MLIHQFPNLQWLKRQAEARFFKGPGPDGATLHHAGWPTVMLNVKAEETCRDNIPGPLSFFSNESGTSAVSVGHHATRIPDNCFFMTNPGQRYTLEIDKRTPAETFNVHFGEQWAEQVLLASHPHEKNLDDPTGVPTFSFYNKLYRKDATVVRLISVLKSEKNMGTLKRDEVLFALVSHLLETHYQASRKETLLSAARLSTREEVLKRLHRATDYIYAEYTGSITLDQLSSVSALSRFHFVREFKRAFGKAPHQYVMEVRINKAKDLLTYSALDVQDVGRAVGFDTASSFSRQFRNQVGVYPTAWRAATT